MSSDYLAKRVFAFGVGFMSFFRIKYHNPPASSVFLSKHHGRTGGYFEHFLAIKPINKVPKERGTRSNAGLGASGYTLFSSLSFDRSSDFVCLADILFTILMILFTLRSLGR